MAAAAKSNVLENSDSAGLISLYRKRAKRYTKGMDTFLRQRTIALITLNVAICFFVRSRCSASSINSVVIFALPTQDGSELLRNT